MLRLLLLCLSLWGMTQTLSAQIGLTAANTTPDTSLIFADTSELTMNMLAVPAVPAFTMLGIAPTTIEKPKDLKEMLFSVANATQNLSVLPNSFAMEVAPFLILRPNRLSLTEYLENNILDNFMQSFSLSVATNTLDSIPGVMPLTTDLALAAKFSLLRGRVSDTTMTLLAQVDSILTEINRGAYPITDSLIQTLPSYQAIAQQSASLAARAQADSIYRGSIEFQLAMAQIDTLTTAFNSDSTFRFEQVQSYFDQRLDRLTAVANKITFNRYGFKLDAAAGLVYDFPNQIVDSVSLQMVGAWITGGQVIKLSGQNKPVLSFLAMGRVLNNLNQFSENVEGMTSTQDNFNLDVGVKVDFTRGDKLSVSGEFLRRFPLNNDLLAPTYRWAVNGAYQVAPNYQLSMTFGRNFNGTRLEDGNLLAALHLFGTFGRQTVNTQ